MKLALLAALLLSYPGVSLAGENCNYGEKKAKSESHSQDADKKSADLTDENKGLADNEVKK